MASDDKRQNELTSLHPAIRRHVKAVKDKLNAEGFKFDVFEAYRSPNRQAFLFAQGRTRPG